MPVLNDSRIVLTLDAGGTNFRFSAIQGGRQVGNGVAMSSDGDNLEKSLSHIIEGFNRVRQESSKPPVAISFAFPAPADFPNGIIGDLYNLPGYRGGVPLGPILEEKFGLPVFINNDGDLFVYGEAIAGLLPHVNRLLAEAGSAKRYNNLFGVTLGTGFGGGIVRNGELFLGDNSMAAEVWLLRNRVNPETNAEEGASIRAVRGVYARQAGIDSDSAPEPKEIFEIGMGQRPGNRAAAEEAFRQLGRVVGDAMGNALTLVDGLGVIGGGLSGAAPLFMPALMKELNSTYTGHGNKRYRRLACPAFNLDDPGELATFLKGDEREISVPGTNRKLKYDPLQRMGVGLSQLGTSEAVAIGAYVFALRRLDAQKR